MNQLKSKKIVRSTSAPSKKVKVLKKSTVNDTATIEAKKRVISKAPVSKKASEKKLTKKQASESLSSATASKVIPDSVKLPKNMSVRAIEKTELIKSNFDEYMRKSMYRISYVTGMCFLLVGSFLATSQFFTVDNPRLMLGELASSDGVSTTTATTNEQISIPDPEFHFLSKVPEVILDDYRINFSVTNAKFVKTHLRRDGFSRAYSLDFESLPDNKYRVVIPAGNPSLSAGYYKLSVFIMPQNSTTGIVRESRLFHIKPLPVEAATTTTNTSTGDNNAESTVAPEEAEEKLSDSQTSVNENEVEAPQVKFFVVPPSNPVISGTRTFAFFAPVNATSIELHSRSVGTLEKTFLATSKNLFGNDVFNVNTTDLGDGEYQFFATAKLDGQTIKSEPIRVTVRNVVPKVDPPQSVQPPEGNSSKDVTPGLPTGQPREFDPSLNQNIEQTNDPIDDTAGRFVTENLSSFEELIKRLAVAQQSGDPMMIELSIEAIEQKRRSIVNDSLRDPRIREISSDIDDQLTERIDNFKKRVEIFESLRRERSAGETSIDTDKDGISDYDEVNIYGTDPNNPDTDNDGFTDGIEIMRGYNPNDSSPEAIIVFESPKESIGLVREDVLEVMEVLPVVSVDEESSTTTPAKAQIRGRGLPNTFITLYIFSTPTVVTIRTDADGLFVYTFEKELEDGQHDVYVAMTDNAGEIIAQSKPFSFIKTAQAFTPVDAAESQEVNSAPITETSKSSYKVVVGLGILAFGLILLMLGISLRPKGESDSEDGPDIGDDVGDQTKKANSRFEHIDAS